MKALSLWQPWASALAAGYKRFETRSWPCPPSLGNTLLAIHAGLHWTAAERRFWNEMRERWPELSSLPKDPPRGGVIAVVRMFPSPPSFKIDQHVIAGRTRLEKDLGIWKPGQYAWQFDALRPLRRLVPCPGGQRIFNLTAETTRLVEGAL